MRKFCALFFVFLMTMSFVLADTNCSKERGYISTSTTLTKEVTPNVAQVIFSVRTSDKVSKVATEKNNQITQTLISELKKNIDTKKGEKLYTSNYNLSQKYVYANGKSTFDGFEVNNTVNVELKNLNKLSTVIDAGIKSGATSVSGIDFKIDNADKEKALLIKEATIKSQKDAEIVATALGTTLDGIKSIHINGYNPSALNRSVDNVAFGAKMMNSASETSTPVEVGKIVVRVTIDANFYVKQGLSNGKF